MTDIVERLRTSASQAGYPKHYIYDEAADEIERLLAERDAARAERDEAIERGNDWCDQAQKARAEAARLREAAVAFDAAMADLWEGGPVEAGHINHIGGVDVAWFQLRAALAAKEPGRTEPFPYPELRAALREIPEAEINDAIRAARGKAKEAATMRDTLAALVERVEQAAGPDRDIDFAVAAAVGWPDSPHSHQHARRYTEHLDAAVSLVPEGHGWHIQNNPSVGACWAAVSSTRHALPWGCGMRRAATPALALCAAALRARMESER